jgi:acetone carboxylase gamma subunit
MTARLLTEYLEIVDGEIRCRECGHVFGPSTRNYKLSALMRELPLEESNPHLRDPAIYTDSTVTFRQFICPGCGTLLQTEVAVDGAPPRWDIRVE